MKITKSGIPINVGGLEKVMQESVTTALFLSDYFRLNLIYLQLISGKGLDFDRIRQFQPGDDPRRIDWKVYAKTQKLSSRVYKEERKFNIVLVLDTSDSMLLGTTAKTKAEYAAVIAGALAYAALDAGDQVSVVLLNEDKGYLVTDPLSDLVEVMSSLLETDYYGGPKMWHKLVTQLQSNYAEDAIVFVLSDFIDSNLDIFLPGLSSFFAKTYGIMIRDPIDTQLPSGVGKMYLQDPHGKSHYLTDLDTVKDEYAVLAQKEMDKVETKFHEYGQLFFKIKTDEEFAQGFVKAMGGEGVEIS